MLVVRRIDIIFNKYTPGRDGCRYEIQPLKIIPTVQFGALFIYCALYEVCLCVFVCVHWRVTQGQWQDSAPAAPCNATHPTALTPTPTPPFCCDTSLVPTDWTTRSPFMPPVHQLDCTLGSLCRRAWSCRFLPLFGF